MRLNRLTAATRLSIAAVMGVFLVFNVAEAKALSPYSAFQALSTDDLVTLEVKLTYGGPQTKGIRPLLFSSIFNPPNIGHFVPFRQTGFNYINDDSMTPRTFSATIDNLRQVIDSVATLPNVTAGGINTADPRLSFALYSPTSGGMVFEAVLGRGDIRDLFTQLRSALSDNQAAEMELGVLGCILGATDPVRPTDVTGNVSVTLGGVRFRRVKNTFVGTLSIKNSGNSTLGGPISVVFRLPTNVHLVAPTGYTCVFRPPGEAFANLAVPSLPSGQSAQIRVGFDNGDLRQIDGAFQVLAGPGTR